MHAHYCDEILQYLDWLENKEFLSDTEMKCFRSVPGSDNSMTASNFWVSLRQNFHAAKVVLVEISSIKQSLHQNLYFNLLNSHAKNKRDTDQLPTKIAAIQHHLLEKGKFTVFIEHNNSYSRNIRGYIPNRMLLHDAFTRANKIVKMTIVDPTEIINKYGQAKCLLRLPTRGGYDMNHYTKFMINTLTRYIQCKLKKFWVKNKYLLAT
jgi:hypothetical protein